MRAGTRRTLVDCLGGISIPARTIYFAMAGLAWFRQPILFVIGCALVTGIVYRREYLSEAFAVIDT